MLSSLLIPASLGLILLGKEAILVVAGEDYYLAWVGLTILSLAIPFSLYSNLLTTCILVPLKKESKVFLATLIGAAMNIALNFLLIPFWGVNAAALTTLIAEIFVFCLSFLYCRKSIKLVNFKEDLIGIF